MSAGFFVCIAAGNIIGYAIVNGPILLIAGVSLFIAGVKIK